jgi:hypothetical protein
MSITDFRALEKQDDYLGYAAACDPAYPAYMQSSGEVKWNLF